MCSSGGVAKRCLLLALALASFRAAAVAAEAVDVASEASFVWALSQTNLTDIVLKTCELRFLRTDFPHEPIRFARSLVVQADPLGCRPLLDFNYISSVITLLPGSVFKFKRVELYRVGDQGIISVSLFSCNPSATPAPLVMLQDVYMHNEVSLPPKEGLELFSSVHQQPAAHGQVQTVTALPSPWCMPVVAAQILVGLDPNICFPFAASLQDVALQVPVSSDGSGGYSLVGQDIVVMADEVVSSACVANLSVNTCYQEALQRRRSFPDAAVVRLPVNTTAPNITNFIQGSLHPLGSIAEKPDREMLKWLLPVVLIASSIIVLMVCRCCWLVAHSPHELQGLIQCKGPHLLASQHQPWIAGLGDVIADAHRSLALLLSPTPGGIRLGPLLGAGSYGRVYQGLYQGKQVAVKVLVHTAAETAKVANELALSQVLIHPNLVHTIFHGTNQPSQSLSFTKKTGTLPGVDFETGRASSGQLSVIPSSGQLSVIPASASMPERVHSLLPSTTKPGSPAVNAPGSISPITSRIRTLTTGLLGRSADGRTAPGSPVVALRRSRSFERPRPTGDTPQPENTTHKGTRLLRETRSHGQLSRHGKTESHRAETRHGDRDTEGQGSTSSIPSSYGAQGSTADPLVVFVPHYGTGVHARQQASSRASSGCVSSLAPSITLPNGPRYIPILASVITPSGAPAADPTSTPAIALPIAPSITVPVSLSTTPTVTSHVITIYTCILAPAPAPHITTAVTPLSTRTVAPPITRAVAPTACSTISSTVRAPMDPTGIHPAIPTVIPISATDMPLISYFDEQLAEGIIKEAGGSMTQTPVATTLTSTTLAPSSTTHTPFSMTLTPSIPALAASSTALHFSNSVMAPASTALTAGSTQHPPFTTTMAPSSSVPAPISLLFIPSSASLQPGSSLTLTGSIAPTSGTTPLGSTRTPESMLGSEGTGSGSFSHSTGASKLPAHVLEEIRIQETWIAMELCDGGSLARAEAAGLLRDRVSKQPNLHLLLGYLRDVAKGMAYLHSQGIIHGDLKMENVLLKSIDEKKAEAVQERPTMMAKVGDFGLARAVAVGRSHLSTRAVGTVTHAPPELLQRGTLRPAADVFAFGIMMYELATGRKAYKGLREGEVVHKVVVCRTRPLFPSGLAVPQEYLALAQACWDHEPDERPTFVEVQKCLASLLERLPAEEVSAPPLLSPAATSSALARADTTDWEQSGSTLNTLVQSTPRQSRAPVRFSGLKIGKAGRGLGQSSAQTPTVREGRGTWFADAVLPGSQQPASFSPAAFQQPPSSTSSTPQQPLTFPLVAPQQPSRLFLAAAQGSGEGGSSTVGAPVQGQWDTRAPHAPVAGTGVEKGHWVVDAAALAVSPVVRRETVSAMAGAGLTGAPSASGVAVQGEWDLNV